MLSFSILLASLACLANASKAPQGTLHRRNYFYTGGTYVPQGNLTFVHGQMYVEHLQPAVVTKPYPLLFIEGAGMTGTNLLNTPDGRLGWADYFMSKGYELYIVDQPARARSAWLQGVDGNQSVLDVVYTESHFTASQNFDLWPVAGLHTQWPGNGSFGDPTFNAFYKSMHPYLPDYAEESNLIAAAGKALLNQIGDVILLTHSQSGQFGWTLGDENPDKIKAIVALEPTGPPFADAVFVFNATVDRPYGITITPVQYDPPLKSPDDLKKVVVSSVPQGNYTCYKQAEPARKLVNLAKMPIYMVSSESSFHAVYDPCTADYLRQAGCNLDYTKLEDVGIHGNGHMMFMEKNNIEIAEKVIAKWLDEKFH